MVECLKKHIIAIIAVSLVIIATVVTVVVLVWKNKEKKDNKEQGNTPVPQNVLTVLLRDSEMKRPNIRLNSEFELVKLENGITGMLISDPFANKSHIQLSMKFGYFIDTVQGISHFGEHMVLQGSEKYGPIYPLFRKFEGVLNEELNAMTSGFFQVYYITVPFNFLYQDALDYLTDAFRYPLYKADIIKNEVQAVNHEFYDSINDDNIEEDIIRQLSSEKTSFNGMGCGNNETLRPNESEILSKKLKGYHMIIKNPKNIFFTLYSNKTIKDSEEDAKKYMNYQMHIFPDNEIDVTDKEQLEKNIKDLESNEIFDENIYKHGFFYNTYKQTITLKIYYFIGKIDYNELKLDIVDYFGYLFHSESLFNILKERNYIAMDELISINRDNYIDNNNYFYVELKLTEEGLKNINHIILYVNKYIDIMKEEGYKRDYYNNFIHYLNNQLILGFNKNNYMGMESYLQMHFNYFYFDHDKILLSSYISEDNYDEDILKKYLNLITYDKSFYSLHSRTKVTELTDLNSVLDNIQKVTLKYYNSDFMLGTIPISLETQIKDKMNKISGLAIRKLNPYFSTKYNETVTPCYKEANNNCKKNNEFDYEKDDKYNGIQLEDDKKDIYATFYQIDKSSESHLVYSYLEFSLDDLPSTLIELFLIEEKYIKLRISELLEIKDTINYEFNGETMILFYKFKTFSDNTEKIINKFIDLITEIPTEEDFNQSKIITVDSIYEEKSLKFEEYVFNILNQIMKNELPDDYEEMILHINNTEYERFKDYHLGFLDNINLIKFKIAGNIDQNLVQNIHNHIKEKIPITTNSAQLKSHKLKNNEPYVKNHYLKSKFDSPENGIVVVYKVPQEYTTYFYIFNECFTNIAMKYLRFEYNNSYTPMNSFEDDSFTIYEQGLYKEVDQMEDDINKVLLDIIEGRITIQNFKEIWESFFGEGFDKKEEKNLDNLFDKFVTDENNQFNILNEQEPPKNFAELVELIKPVFTYPQRTTLLIARKDLKDEDFSEMFDRRSQISDYLLNNTITITHKYEIIY